jgi:hypothetical protein
MFRSSALNERAGDQKIFLDGGKEVTEVVCPWGLRRETS